MTHGAAGRMDSIDYFRGLSVILMVLVDYVGGIASVPGWLKHAPDIGLTVADLHEQGVIDLDLMLLFWLPYIACAMLGVRYQLRRAARPASATGEADHQAIVVAELVEDSTAGPPGRIAPRRRTAVDRR